ncbi:MAG: hypothetical protein HBSIN02_21270 [Bacteroidia bacterium]|nr:MAG: hypothetical protein HBSIN02_21270 [Bacteroidia bacterium]
MNTMITFLILTLAGVASRLVPHPPNVTAIAAIALVGGISLDRRMAIAVPVTAMVLSDIILGFHGLMVYVYAGFLMTGALGMALRSAPRLPSLIGGSLAGSVLFFIVTNGGVWLTGDGTFYPKTIEGLLACYSAGLPFFRNSLLGDLFYTGVLAALFEGVRAWSVSRTA